MTKIKPKGNSSNGLSKAKKGTSSNGNGTSKKHVDAITVADQFSVSPKFILGLANRGEIPYVKLGRLYRFNLAEVGKALGCNL